MANAKSEKVNKALEGLSEEELREIYEPLSVEKGTYTIQFLLEEEEEVEDEQGNKSKKKVRTSASLHAKIERECYVVHAKYKYRAWVTTADGRGFHVDEITATMDSGNGRFHKRVNNTSSLTKQDDVYAYGNACKSAYMLAKARKGNATAAVEVRL